MRPRIRTRVVHALQRLEGASRGWRLRLQASAARRRNAGTDLSRTNTAAEWARIYGGVPPAVTALTDPVARAVAEHTRPGEVLLEAGCGSATLSAQLATAGRRVYLADFSQDILDRGRDLFRRSGLAEPQTVRCDLTRPLPLPDGAVDVVWSSGVLEHWTDEELGPIVSEMARVSRRRVISLVPSARCVFYRLAKHCAEEAGVWPFGRELPRDSLKDVFERAGLGNVTESYLCPESTTGLLALTDPPFQRVVERWWKSLDDDDPAKRNQGYLLLTIGDKPA